MKTGKKGCGSDNEIDVLTNFERAFKTRHEGIISNPLKSFPKFVNKNNHYLFIYLLDKKLTYQKFLHATNPFQFSRTAIMNSCRLRTFELVPM